MFCIFDLSLSLSLSLFSLSFLFFFFSNPSFLSSLLLYLIGEITWARSQDFPHPL